MVRLAIEFLALPMSKHELLAAGWTGTSDVTRPVSTTLVEPMSLPLSGISAFLRTEDGPSSRTKSRSPAPRTRPRHLSADRRMSASVGLVAFSPEGSQSLDAVLAQDSGVTRHRAPSDLSRPQTSSSSGRRSYESRPRFGLLLRSTRYYVPEQRGVLSRSSGCGRSYSQYTHAYKGAL
jgi:hypothetical protein